MLGKLLFISKKSEYSLEKKSSDLEMVNTIYLQSIKFWNNSKYLILQPSIIWFQNLHSSYTCKTLSRVSSSQDFHKNIRFLKLQNIVQNNLEVEYKTILLRQF